MSDTTDDDLGKRALHALDYMKRLVDATKLEFQECIDRIEELEAKLAAERERIADLERRLKLWEPQNTWSLDGGRWPIRKGDTP
jgi:predicted RNase H-like nuclease (RuvC/YqgF family)